MSKEHQESKEFDSEPTLDRREIAVTLRGLGIDVDFEDWDGLDDNDLMGIIATLATMYDFDLDEIFALTLPIENRRREELGE